MEQYTYNFDTILLIELIGKKSVELYTEANDFLKKLDSNYNKPDIRKHLYNAINKIIQRDINEYFS